jgi:hypothetical protein
MLIAWAGYTGVMWGYCLVRDYNVTVPQLFASAWPSAVSSTNAPAGAATGSTSFTGGQVGAPGVSLNQGVTAATPGQIASSFPVID